MSNTFPGEAGRKRKERRESIENRQRILTTARKLFGENGVKSVSMRQIAREAQVGQGTLYRQFADKGAVCEALLGQFIEEFQLQFEARCKTRTERPAKLIEELLEHVASFTDTNNEMVSTLVEVALSERRYVFSHVPFYTWVRDKIVELLEVGVETGELQPLDAEYSAYVILSPLVLNVFVHKDSSSEKILQTMRQLLIGGLLSR